ncbi:MAG TPA: MauE/DoxX family redox-associated membrane protein [Acidimicrobiales bacterium]|nr:MauE/DoxX family redox-associated membrane protein [Acidimicrobiales bacterium]
MIGPMIPSWAAALPALALLLVCAGAAKAARPEGTARALRQSGVPVGPALVRVGAGAEVIVGAAVLGRGGPVATAALAVSYIAFAGFVAHALVRRLPLSSCGCFGVADTPPTAVHVVLCAAAGGVAAAAVMAGAPPGVGTVLSDLGPAPAVGYVVLSLTAAATLYLVLAHAPRVVAMRQQLRSGS